MYIYHITYIHVYIIILQSQVPHVLVFGADVVRGLEGWILGLCLCPWVSPPASHSQWSDGGGTVMGPLVAWSPDVAKGRNALSPRCSDSTYLYIHLYTYMDISTDIPIPLQLSSTPCSIAMCFHIH